MRYTIFVRNWWKIVTDRYGTKRKEPDTNARRTVIGYANSIQEAQDICREYNQAHDPGPLSRKAEFTDDF